MILKRREDHKPFVAVDGSEVVEVIGLSTTGTSNVSLAYATVKPNLKTLSHNHEFTEVYVVEEGEGLMHVNDESRYVRGGDHVLIPAKSWHHVENSGETSLTLICVCTPAFSKDRTEVKRNLTRRLG